MTVFNDGKLKQIHSLIELARKIYLEQVDSTGTTAEEACKNALALLEKCEGSYWKSIHACNANVTLFLVILKDLRLLNVERDPLNASDDLFMPTTTREQFVPKPPEKLCPKSFRVGFDRLEVIRKEALEIWTKHIWPAYPSLDSQEMKAAALKATCDLATASLLSAQPFDALQLFYHVHLWAKQSCALRWFLTLLLAADCPKTARNIAMFQLEQGLKADKNGTHQLMRQIVRLGTVIEETNDNGSVAADEETNANKLTIVQRRLDSVSSFVDCFEIEQAKFTKSLGLAASQSRRYATHIFSHFNNMETCTMVSADGTGTQNCMDVVWFFKTLFNDALMQHRTGRIRRAELLFREGFNVAFVLCSPYWLLKFSTHLAQCHCLMEITDSEITQRLLFVQSIFCKEDPLSDVIRGNETDPTICTRSISKKVDTKTKNERNDRSIVVELSRRADTATDEHAKPAVLRQKSARNIVEKDSRRKPSASSIDDACHCRCTSDTFPLNVSIFQAVMAKFTQSTEAVDQATQCLDILQTNVCPKPAKEHNYSTLPNGDFLDQDELCFNACEPLWNLLDFYLLLSGKSNGVAHFTSEEINVIDIAIGSLPSVNLGLFTLYLRLAFSFSRHIWQWSKLSPNIVQSDITNMVANLNLNSDTVSRRTRRRVATTKTVKDIATNGSLSQVAENVQRYGHVQFYPWYRSATQSLGLSHLLDCRANSPSKIDSMALSAAYFLESTAISFRHSFLDKINGSGTNADHFYRFFNEESLLGALEKLPLDWTIVSLHVLQVGQNKQLVLCRLSGRCRPIVINLPDAFEKIDAIAEFGTMTQEIEKSIKETDKRIFWECRRELEMKIAALLEQLQNKWFGCNRAAFAGFSKKTQCILMDRLVSVDGRQLEALLTATVLSTKEEKRQYLGNTLFKPDLLDELIGVTETIAPSANPGPVFLILDKELHHIPWENMPVLRYRPTCRIPSLQHLVHMVSTMRLPKKISCEKAFYVVNPSSDLQVTEDFFKWFSEVKCWNGLFRQQPSLKTMKEVLEKNDIYLYCGHGSNVKCLESFTVVEQLSCNAAPLLMGCASVKLINRGPIFEPDGMPFFYLLAQSPCVIGCLWGVTSPDIDRFLAQVLKMWLNLVPPSLEDVPQGERDISNFTSLLRAIANANTVCKLRLLTGASVVLYGLPVICERSFSQ